LKKILICPICQTHYLADTNRLKFGRQTTCSRSCSYKLRSIKKSKSITFKCSVCGKLTKRSPSCLKTKHEGHYCSPKCQYIGRSLGLTPRIVNKPYNMKPANKQARIDSARRAAETRKRNGNNHHTEATKKRLRHTTAKAIAEGKFNRVSKLEYKVANEIKKFGVPFIHQYPIRDVVTGRWAACVDFFISKFNLAIEVNGTFWHADPRFYNPNHLHKSQMRTRQRYQAKLILLDKHKISLVEIWEYDIRKDATKAVVDALKGKIPHQLIEGLLQ